MDTENSDYKHNLYFIDYETTGFNPYYNDVIEVAIKKFGESEYFQTLIIPEIDPKKPRAGGIHQLVPDKIVGITGITDKMLIDEGIKTNISTMKTLEYILKHSTKDKQPIYLIAHNGSVFDFILLKRLMREANILGNSHKSGGKYTEIYEMTKRFRFIDTCLLARMYMREEKATQPILCKKHNIQNDAEHRALGDILALEKLYPIMCSKVSNVLGEDESWLLNNPQEVIETLMIG